MGLLSSGLLALLAALTVATPVATYLLWHRFRGGRTRRSAARYALVLTAQLSAVCLAAAVINDYGLFFRSWSELTGGLSQVAGLRAPQDRRPDPADRGAAVTPTDTSIEVRTYHHYSRPDQWPTLGRVESISIAGATSRLRSNAYVYLPPQYFQPAYAHVDFPVIEVFTGYPGLALNLVARMRYPNVLRQLIAQGSAEPDVLVMLRPPVTFPRDTECTDVPGHTQAETFFGSDVPAAMAAHYRVLATGWGAIGDSTGGYCATKLAMLNPNQFPAAAEMSGYFFALRDRTTGDLWDHSSVVRELNDLHWRLTHQPAPDIALLVCTSPQERGPDGYLEAMRFVHEVKPPMRVDVLTVPDGGHNFATWETEMPYALRWLSQRIERPEAQWVPLAPTSSNPAPDPHPVPRGRR